MSSDKESASKWLIKCASDAKKNYIIASALTLLSAACFVMFSWYLAKYSALWLNLDQIAHNKLIYAFVFLVGRYVFAHFASVINYKAGNAIVSRIKTSIYPRLLNNNQTDSITSMLLVTKVSDDLKPYFSFFIPYAIASVLVGIFLLIVSFYFEIWAGISLLVTFIVIPLLMTMIGVGAESLHKKHISLFVKYSSVFYNRLHTIAEIVNLNNLKQQHAFLSEKSTTLNQATTNVMRVAVLSSAILELFVTIAIAAIAIYLGIRLLGIMPGSNYGKGYDFQIALFLLMLAPYFFFYLRKFVSAYHDKNKALASAKLIMPHLDIENEATITDTNENIERFEINDLSFAYPNSPTKVLHNIHLKLPLKGLVLVKGISGSGKSTLLKILAGNLSFRDGFVNVNGNNNIWTSQWLKYNTSYMNQFPFIFDGTLRYNVFLKDGISSTKKHPSFLNKVLEKKEDGWETMLSHNGKQLSGGEKQLVTLARMLLYPKPVAIFDEPTANLDPNTIDIIIEQIKVLSQDKLLIVASHEEKFEAIATTTLHLNWGEQMTYEDVHN
jgi:ATP-binding cassette, subfamily C, bacterial CydD